MFVAVMWMVSRVLLLPIIPSELKFLCFPVVRYAYSDPQLTPNFVFWLWAEIFCVSTCFYIRIPKFSLSVRTKKKITISYFNISPTLVNDRYCRRQNKCIKWYHLFCCWLFIWTEMSSWVPKPLFLETLNNSFYLKKSKFNFDLCICNWYVNEKFFTSTAVWNSPPPKKKKKKKKLFESGENWILTSPEVLIVSSIWGATGEDNESPNSCRVAIFIISCVFSFRYHHCWVVTFYHIKLQYSKIDSFSYISSQEHACPSVSAVMFCNNFSAHTVHIDRSAFSFYP